MFEIDYQLVLAFRDDVVGRVRDANMPAALLEASDEERSREVAAIVVREHAENLVNSGSTCCRPTTRRLWSRPSSPRCMGWAGSRSSSTTLTSRTSTSTDATGYG